ncbi:MAG: adenosylmethionine decarboxylase [Candidatus Wildermuthbacteria bacterium]|nr:adenosylmethionine decarboxylase [Candidatus Wildermuthbacteria bacterium]
MRKFSYAGTHIIADFWSPKEIQTTKELKRILLGAAKAAKSTVLGISFHEFKPRGVTGLLLLSESHIALHSWPEVSYLAVDIFTCGKKSRPKLALQFLEKELKPKNVVMQEIKRGDIQQAQGIIA